MVADDSFVESKAFQLANICCVLEMALTVTMACGTLKDNQKILVVKLLALHFCPTPVYYNKCVKVFQHCRNLDTAGNFTSTELFSFCVKLPFFPWLTYSMSGQRTFRNCCSRCLQARYPPATEPSAE